MRTMSPAFGPGRRILLRSVLVMFIGALGPWVFFSAPAIAAFCKGPGAAPAGQRCDLHSYGGQGGGFFREECPPGYFLSEIMTKAGVYVDRVTPRCTPVGKTEGTGDISLGSHGGTGGSPSWQRPVRKPGSCETARYMFVKEQRRLKIIPNAFGEKPVLKLMSGAMLRAAERWRPIRIASLIFSRASVVNASRPKTMDRFLTQPDTNLLLCAPPALQGRVAAVMLK